MACAWSIRLAMWAFAFPLVAGCMGPQVRYRAQAVCEDARTAQVQVAAQRVSLEEARGQQSADTVQLVGRLVQAQARAERSQAECSRLGSKMDSRSDVLQAVFESGKAEERRREEDRKLGR